MAFEQKIDYLIDFYVHGHNFYKSWTDATSAMKMDFLWLSYDDITTDTYHTILVFDYYDIELKISEADTNLLINKLKSKRSRFNKEFLEEDQH